MHPYSNIPTAAPESCVHLALSLSVAVRSEMWPSLLSTMKLDAAEFIDKHLEMILPRLLEANTDNPV